MALSIALLINQTDVFDKSYFPGDFSGRRCKSCKLWEMSMVEGETLDKWSGVELQDCQNKCDQKIGCSHFNFYFRFV